MKKLLAQKGFLCVTNEDETVSYFYTPEMLKNNVVFEFSIREGTNEKTGETKIETYIAVKHYSEVDAFEWSLYWGTSLEYIQEYRIIMDIFDIYRTFPLPLFIELVEDIASSGWTAAMQSDEVRRKKAIREMQDQFKKIREEAK